MAQHFFAGEPIVAAHRGASAYAPEHTLTAFRLALDQGADVIEADIRLTRDGRPVLHHSTELSESTDGDGPIGEHTLAEIRDLDAGYRWSPDTGGTFPYRGRGERIITVAEALEAFPDTRFNLDIKERRAAIATRRVIDEHNAQHRVLLASWYSWRRAPALRGYPGPRSVTFDQMLPYMLLHWGRLDRLWGPPVDALQVPERYRGLPVVTPRLIRRARERGIRVHVWTVHSEADMLRLLGWGVAGLVTPRPDVAVRARAHYLSGHWEM